jgi:hypothetical protein
MLRKCFSVGRYGAQARQLAIAEREEHLRQMAGLARVHPHELLLRAAPPRPLAADCPAPVAARDLVRSSNTSGIPGGLPSSGGRGRSRSLGGVDAVEGWLVAAAILLGQEARRGAGQGAGDGGAAGAAAALCSHPGAGCA